MALTYSNPFPLGTIAPSFTLLNTVDDKMVSLDSLKGEKGTAIFFICNHCPYVIHVKEGLVKLAHDYLAKGIAFVAISSNDVVHYPQDSPDKMKEQALELAYPFPYLYDETQEVAKAYDATCTPDFYLFDADLKSVYHGRLDESKPQSGIAVTGKDFREAIDLMLEGKQTKEAIPSMGCNIKWK